MNRHLDNITRRGRMSLCAILGLACLLLLAKKSDAQTYVPSGTMTGTPAAGSYYNSGGIRLTSFSFAASSGNSLRVFITPCVPLSASLSSAQNYVSTIVPRVSGLTTTGSLSGLGTCQAMQSVQYFDALGRPMQTVQVKGNPDASRDVIAPQAYDQFGREAAKYLPYTATGDPGSYRSNALTAGTGVYGFYNPSGSGASGTQQGNGVTVIPNPFAATGFEPSPLSRPVEQGYPGDPWQLTGVTNPSGTPSGHTGKIAYATNNATTVTTGSYYAKWYYSKQTITYDGHNYGWSPTQLIDSGFYKKGQLSVTVTKDENWTTGQTYPQLGTIEKYKDKLGRVVLKRTFNYTTSLEVLSTYYVYDQNGNLTFVFPPAANADAGSISQSTLDNLCYQYVYDEKNRVVVKKVPGRGREYFVYNIMDRIVAAQDSMQRTRNQWEITKYDVLGRPIMTGVWNNSNTAISQDSLKKRVYAGVQFDARDYSSTTTGYSVTSYPATLNDILTISYYDDYSIPNLPATYDLHGSYSAMTRGMATASKTAVLNTNGTVSTDMLWDAHYYDDRGRNVRTLKQHYLNGVLSPYNYDDITSNYDFSSSLVSSVRRHYSKNSGNTAAVLALSVTDSIAYDHLGRPVENWNKVNSGTNVLLSRTQYNEVGQPYIKRLHSTNGGTSFLQMVTYGYNERGWLIQNSAPMFTMQLKYDGGTVPQFNGNVSNQVWTTNGQSQKTYTYKYDRLNRLTEGKAGDYQERGISYDPMGNIATLSRVYNNTLIDSLSYSYAAGGSSTSQLQKVSDRSADTGPVGYKAGNDWGYRYDGNGSMTRDSSKALTVAYNMLNLPMANTITGSNAGVVSYMYDAAGQKLRKVSTQGSGSSTDYIDGIQYEGGTISFVQTGEGRILSPVTSPNYEYSLGDHLGNSRVSFDTNSGTANRTQTDDYLPFGLVSESSTASPPNKYLYNGKEVQDGLGYYDYGKRFYDPTIGKWTGVDILSNMTVSESVYSYAGNSPTTLVDVGGGFKIDAEFMRMYPNTAKFITYYLPQLANNSNIRTAFKSITNATDAQFNNMVSYGSGPQIIASGFYNPYVNRPEYGDMNVFNKNFPGNIYLLKDNLDEFEKMAKAFIKGGASSKQFSFAMFKLAAKILHEATHWGLFNFDTSPDHVYSSNQESLFDQGAQFETRAFGSSFSYRNDGVSDAFSNQAAQKYFNQQWNSSSYWSNMTGMVLNGGSMEIIRFIRPLMPQQFFNDPLDTQYPNNKFIHH